MRMFTIPYRSVVQKFRQTAACADGHQREENPDLLRHDRDIVYAGCLCTRDGRVCVSGGFSSLFSFSGAGG
jgi:hypothetical protein